MIMPMQVRSSPISLQRERVSRTLYTRLRHLLGNNWSAVYNFAPNPRAADYSSHSDIYEKMMTFNSCYTHLLVGLHQVFNGSPGSFWAQVKGMMMLATLSKELMAIPVPGKP